MQHVKPEVEHRRPDPHRRDDLDQQQTPVGQEQAQTFHEHCKCADPERERGEDAPAAAEAQYGIGQVDIVITDGLHQQLVPATRRWRRERGLTVPTVHS